MLKIVMIKSLDCAMTYKNFRLLWNQW